MSAGSRPEFPDIARIADALARHQVDYLLVGGIAARAHGARRLTYDIDCLPARTEGNLDRLATAMRELHARLRVEGLSDADAAQLPVQVTGSTLARMEISTWRTDAGDFDVLAVLPGVNGRQLSYDELAGRADALDLDGVVVRVAALDDVIASKEWADRPKDRAALDELRALRRRDAPGSDESSSRDR
jgi:hypothetical protein